MKAIITSALLSLCLSLSVNAQNLPTAAFSAVDPQTCPGDTIFFLDQSFDSVFAWIWITPGGIPDTSYAQNPMIIYPDTGLYTVTLIAGNAYGFDTLTKLNYIKVALPLANAGPDQTICSGDTAVLQAAGQPGGNFSLQTTFNNNNGQRGNMFDLTAINDITILNFEGHLADNTDLAIYYKLGTFSGYQGTPSAWTLVGTATGVTANPIGTPTQIPIPINLTIPAGQTFGWYVTSTVSNVSLKYTNGTAVGNVYVQDGNLQIKEGIGIDYPFGSTYTPRIWNGIVHYASGNVNSYAWSTGATTQAIHVSPIDMTTYVVTITDNHGCSASDSVTVFVITSPVTPTIVQNGNQLNTQSGYQTYQWFVNGNPVPNSNLVTISPSIVGYYTVRVTAANGCDAVSAAVFWSPVGIEDTPDHASFTVSPNPCTDVVDVHMFNAPLGMYALQIINALGELVYSEQIVTVSPEFSKEIDLGQLSRGSYMISLKGESGNLYAKIVKL